MTLIRRWLGRSPPLDDTDVIRTFVATLARLDELARPDEPGRGEDGR